MERRSDGFEVRNQCADLLGEQGEMVLSCARLLSGWKFYGFELGFAAAPGPKGWTRPREQGWRLCLSVSGFF